MSEIREQPLPNPVLTLKMDPRPQSRPGRGKDSSKIVTSRLLQQQRELADDCRRIFRRRKNYPTYAGKLHLFVSMFENSIVPSYTPLDLFNDDVGCRFVAPFAQGFIIEASADSLPLLIRKISTSSNVASRVDISRVKKLGVFDANEVLRGRSFEQLWDEAPEFNAGKLFTVWFAPFRDAHARRALLELVDQFTSEKILLPVYPVLRQSRLQGGDFSAEQLVPIETASQSSIARALHSYRNNGFARATVIFQSRDAMKLFISSGVSYRVDPIKPLGFATSSESLEPGIPVPDVTGQPIVAVVGN